MFDASSGRYEIDEPMLKELVETSEKELAAFGRGWEESIRNRTRELATRLQNGAKILGAMDQAIIEDCEDSPKLRFLGISKSNLEVGRIIGTAYRLDFIKNYDNFPS